MAFDSFDKRIQPHRIAGVPDPVFFFAPISFLLAFMAIVIPLFAVKVAFLAAAAFAAGYSIYVWRTYDDWLIKMSLENGKKMKKQFSFLGQGKNSYVDNFAWQTYCSDNALLHRDGSISIAFVWPGIHDRFYDDDEFAKEHKRRAALLKSLPTDIGLCVEHHLLRGSDTRLIDAYLLEGQEMAKGKEVPPIVTDIRNQLAGLYRPMARSNQVMTVLSIGTKKRKTLTDYLMPSTYSRLRTSKDLLKSLASVITTIANSYPNMRLLSIDEYKDKIQQIYKPYHEHAKIDWRFTVADQIIDEKPIQDSDGCLVIDDTYYKVCLLQNYPRFNFGWLFRFCEAGIDLHVSQIIVPLHVDSSVDKNRSDSKLESKGVSENRGTERAVEKLGNAAQYRQYVMKYGLAIADNAYIVTFVSKNKDHVLKMGALFAKDVLTHEGLVRDNLDLQEELFRLRLPGNGRYSSFLREDHADTIAVTAPFTTFPSGDPRPESLRITSSGQLVGSAPSRLEVAHELVVAETFGGKDTMFGMKFIETYLRVRYDIIELGNSYQGVIEAVGGNYCRAREQVINPLSAYEDFKSAQELTQAGAGRIDVDFVRTQSDLLTPIFKGMQGGTYSKAEEVIANRLIRYVYENPSKDAAPTLPLLYEAMNKIEVSSDKQRQAVDEFGSELYEFLQTETGSCFKERDQFTISPIANGIDFDKFEGELFKYYMMFIPIRLATQAMTRGIRSQIVANEYKVLRMRAPESMHWLTVTIDRMGRKDWVGFTRITQGISEIEDVDPEALNSIPNKTLLSRADNKHQVIGHALGIPSAVIAHWMDFKTPEEMKNYGYREAILFDMGCWHKLQLKFPQLHLDLMNTLGSDKLVRDEAYRLTKDPYKRIQIMKELQKGAKHGKEQALV